MVLNWGTSLDPTFFFFFLISTVWTGCVEYHFAHFPEFLIIDSERGRLDESEHFFADTTFETGEGGYWDPTVKRLPEMESVVRKANGKLNIAKPLLDVFKHRMLK